MSSVKHAVAFSGESATVAAELQRRLPTCTIGNGSATGADVYVTDSQDRLPKVPPQSFAVVVNRDVAMDPARRLAAHTAGAHVVAASISDAVAAIEEATAVPVKDTDERRKQIGGHLTCTDCGTSHLTAPQLVSHVLLRHAHAADATISTATCPICRHQLLGSLADHFLAEHPPAGRPRALRLAARLYSFGLCVIQRRSDGKFLAVQEFCNQGYWLPGGGIDAGEDPVAAAKRECMEEAGVDVNLTGVLRIEFSARSGYTRMRYIFYGHPTRDDAPPKTIPDFESAGAAWISAEELATNDRLRVRGDELPSWARYVAGGGAIHPITLVCAST